MSTPRTSHFHRPRHRQRGTAVLIIVIALAALIAMAGLAIDIGHEMLSKTRLQTAVDAAALAAAKMYDETSSTAQATSAAISVFGANARGAGNRELGSAYSSGAVHVTVQYSSTLPPFTPAADGPYVRVTATGFSLPAWLVGVVGIDQLTVSASAVAGPSPTAATACNAAPVLVCGNRAAGAARLWGYSLNSPQVLKSASGGHSELGPGQFQLIQLGGNGANVVRENLAGSYRACMNVGDSVQPQTGNETGPTAQGLNTRFGQYSGSMSMSDYPPDVLTTAQSPALTADSDGNIWQRSTEITAGNIDRLLYSYSRYTADEGNPAAYDYQPVSAGGPGVFGRRVLAVPVGDCGGGSHGPSSVPVLGFACFFILQPVTQKGSSDYIIGQFVGNCGVNGTPGPNPGSGPGPHVIELYHDPGSGDS